MNAADVLTPAQIEDQLSELPFWRYRPPGLTAVLTLPTARAALDLLARIGGLAEHANHHPDIDWRYNRLVVTLMSHDAGDAVTSRDMALARQISAAGRNAGAAAEPDLMPE